MATRSSGNESRRMLLSEKFQEAMTFALGVLVSRFYYLRPVSREYFECFRRKSPSGSTKSFMLS
jgi:hypothetical protein